MFETTCETLEDNRVHKYALARNGEPLSFRDTLDLLIHEELFRSFFSSVLRDSPFSAYRWETPPVTDKTVTRPFEFVILNSPGLAHTPDLHTYAEYFVSKKTDEGVVVFPNLGKDATLVVPTPPDSGSGFSHLAAFIRNASDAQKDAFWRVVGQTVQEQLGMIPLWLSTAGGGVAWLHVRLDSRPKYYGYEPYTRLT